MEFQISTFPIVIACFFLFLFIVVLKSAKPYKSKSSASNLPPGPWKLPLVGNIHQLAVSSLVHRTLRDLSGKYGPLMHLQLGELSTVIVSSPETAKEIMNTHDTVFAYRPYLLAAELIIYNSTDIVFSPYGDYWKQLRKICTMELLSPQRVQTFRGIREEEVLNMIASVSSSGASINLSRRIFSLTYGITARAAFGKKTRHQDDYISSVEESSAALGGFSIADMYPSVKFLQSVTGMRNRCAKIHNRLDKILQDIVDEHKEREEGRWETSERESTEDLVDVLLRIQKHGELQFPLTDDNLKAVIHDIFSAGSETSSTTLEWAMSEMLKNPEAMRRAQEEVRAVLGKKGNVDESSLHELNYLKLIIKETLRLHPVAPLLIPRECSKDCEISGYLIPAKTIVIVNAWAIGRDPTNWIQPEKFYPDRFLNSGIDFRGSSFNFIPFGAGRRMCPGISFAIPNIELALAQLLYHFDWELPGGLRAEEFDMTEGFGITMRRKNDLCLIPIPYHSSNVV